MKRFFFLLAAVLLAAPLAFVCTACPNSTNASDRTYDLLPDDTVGGASFYIDPVHGNNDNDGNSEKMALKDFVRLSGREFGPGDKILIKSGTTVSGCFKAKGDGNAEAPIVITGYGGSARPVIKMKSTDLTGIDLTSVSFWEVQHVEITSEPSDKNDDSNWRVAIMIHNYNKGLMEHLIINDCYIHNIDTYNGKASSNCPRFFGGIFVNAGPYAAEGAPLNKMDNVQITNNLIEDIAMAGIYFEAWNMPTPYPSGWENIADWGQMLGVIGEWDQNQKGLTTNLIVRGNTTLRTGGDGIMVGWCDHALIEYNKVGYPLYKVNTKYFVGAAMWTANAHYTLIQYNEIYGCTYNADGMALDDDFYGGDNIYQYNYSHDNQGGFFMTMGTGENVIVRYNISVNDASVPDNSADTANAGKSTRAFQGLAKGMKVYNNIIYMPPSTNGGGADLVGWWGWDPQNGPVYFANNIFYLNGDNWFHWGKFNVEPGSPGYE
ncbi:MAG: hypothetical protein FWF29_08260, partial [Treponema sp.]|nr:hypothetical protein [Treponema sp.]